MSYNTILATAPLTTQNFVLKANGTTIGNSLIFDNGTNVGIGNTNTTYKLDVSGTGNFTGALSGTSATFSSSVTATNGTFTGAASSVLNVRSISASSYATTDYYNSSNVQVASFGYANASVSATVLQNSAYIYTPSGIDFVSFIGANERMRITSGGNVGIGCTPSNLLQTNQTGASGYFYSGQQSGTEIAYWYYNATTIEFSSKSATRALSFLTTDTERMRITSGGNVCINSTSPLDASAKLNVSGNVYLGATASGAGNSTLKYNTGTGLVSFDTSARIFKKDIVDLEYGLDAVLKMSSKKYKWKLNETEDFGFIADEMYKIIPEVVFLANNNINQTGLEDNEPMGINYDRLIPVIVKAMQEQQATITSLNERLNKAGL